MKVSDELIHEQNLIIDSLDSRIVVSAGPGAGKTYTIVKKAIKELQKFEDDSINKGVVMCSFTREASLELDKRLKKYISNDFSYVGTIDSFLLTDLINPFKNRILKKLRPNSSIIRTKLKISIPTLDKNASVNILTRQGITVQNRAEIVKYYNQWINNLISGKYEVSFAAYLFAGTAIEEVSELHNYFNSRYHSMYIDESQDLNAFQIWFIKRLISFTNINCYLIGDKRQSIYSFRGAKPDLFYSMINEGFTELKITHSARCHYNILEFSRRIVGESSETIKIYNDKRVRINYPITQNLGFLNTIEDYFILVETNAEAELIYDKCLENSVENVIFTKRIEIKSDKDFADNYFDISEEILKFYFNHNNMTPNLTYSIEDLSRFLQPIIDHKKLNIKQLSIEKDESPTDFIYKIFQLGDLTVPEEVISEIGAQIEQEVYKNHYIRKTRINRIMTIHSAKGLEATYIFVQFERKWFPVNDEMKRKLFVGFTRAKERLVIGFQGNGNSPLEEYIGNSYNRTFN
jgi:superfamily I DNA/RNA helicase